MIKLIKCLFKRKEPQPDVLIEDCTGVLRLYVSRTVAGRRVIEHPYGDLLLLQDDGTVRGSHWAKKWEAL